MARFLGLLLMLITGAVVVELIATAHLEPSGTAWVLGLSMGLLGLLVGVLATARQWAWAVIGALTVTAPQWFAGRIVFPPPPGGEFQVWLLCLISPLALILGAVLGTRVLRRTHQALIKPEHDD